MVKNFVKLIFWLLHPSEQLMLQRRNDKMNSRLGISFDARTLPKGGFFSESAIRFSNLQISERNTPNHYPELEI